MTGQPYSLLARYKQWADRGLYELVGQNLARLDAEDGEIALRLLDHIHVVDSIFQHHLRGLPHAFKAPRSEPLPDFPALMNGVAALDEWYVDYAGNLPEQDFDQPVDFVFTNGTAARMRRGEIILHVCLHGSYHRGNVGLILRKNGVMPTKDRVTDYLEAAA